MRPEDRLHERAKVVVERLGPHRIVTSEMVLVEFLDFMGVLGEQSRKIASNAVARLADDPKVEVVPQTSRQFEAAVALYASRLDKRWSVADCASFILMEERNIREALAHDRDFAQAGFAALLREAPGRRA